eukprot:9388663-Pyramimonas_sp.AAC.1
MVAMLAMTTARARGHFSASRRLGRARYPGNVDDGRREDGSVDAGDDADSDDGAASDGADADCADDDDGALAPAMQVLEGVRRARGRRARVARV